MVAERPNLYAIPYNASGLTRDDDGEMIGVRWEGLTIHSKLVGDYNLNNIAAALAMAAYFAVARKGPPQRSPVTRRTTTARKSK